MTSTLIRRLPAIALAFATVAFVVLGASAVRLWLNSHDAALLLQATVSAQKHVLDRAALNQQQRAAKLAKNLVTIAQDKRKVQTPSEVIAQLPSALPTFEEPISLSLPSPRPGEPLLPATVTIPQSDLKPLYDYLQDCRACTAKLDAAEGDLADERAKVAALTIQRDAAIRSAARGGFWHCVKHNAKWFVIGGAAGALAFAATHR